MPDTLSCIKKKSGIIKGMSSQWLEGFFYFSQIILGVVAVLYLAYLMFRAPKSNFKIREADRKRCPTQNAATPSAKHRPLQLEGIRIDGEPHEILGLSPFATEKQIQQAYRNLMKRYHPDRIGPPGSREWQDAQKIAEAINLAKETLLKKAAGSASGRFKDMKSEKTSSPAEGQKQEVPVGGQKSKK